MKMKILFTVLCIMIFSPASGQQDKSYENFKVAVYSRAYETEKMGDINYIQPIWDEIVKQVKVDRIYLETHRDLLIVDQETLDKAKAFFHSRGVETEGGITLTVDESNRFETFCYTNPEHRKKVQEIVEHTARNFNEIILDDFFFTNCKCDLCIEAKGEKSWTDYRLEMMDKAAHDIVINPAKAVNPDVKVIIKYPNWYEHFPGLGFNLETQPPAFDGLYTGTETRDPSGNQHLQAYLGYLVFRYFENLKPGANLGGWVDTGGMNYMDRYAEQLWITMFARAPEITLFDIRQLQRPIRETDRAEWQGTGTSFDFDEMMIPVTLSDNTRFTPTTIARAAGYTFEKIDKFLGALGKPLGVKSYKPFHSTGEDFLQTYMGMIGVPMDIVPEFPFGEKMVFLTEAAAFDPEIVDKIKQHLENGNQAMITSGLLKALENKGIKDIVELQVTDRKASVDEFAAGWGPSFKSDHKMIIPQITYLTNDSWEEISALDKTNGWPLLHSAAYGSGRLYVMTIPDNFIDLYHLPVPVLNRLKETLTADLPVMIESPGYTSLFLYDNNTFIVESFADSTVNVNVVTSGDLTRLRNLETNEIVTGSTREAIQMRSFSREAKNVFNVGIKPHSFVVLELVK